MVSLSCTSHIAGIYRSTKDISVNVIVVVVVVVVIDSRAPN